MFTLSRLVQRNHPSPFLAYWKLWLYTSPCQYDSNDRKKTTKTVKNTVKHKNTTGPRALINEISGVLQPERENYKERRTIEQDIKHRLQIISDETELKRLYSVRRFENFNPGMKDSDELSSNRDAVHTRNADVFKIVEKKAGARSTERTKNIISNKNTVNFPSFTHGSRQRPVEKGKFHDRQQNGSRYAAKNTVSALGMSGEILGKFQRKNENRKQIYASGSAARHTSDDSVIDGYVEILLGSKERLKLFDPVQKTGTAEATSEVAGAEKKTAIDWWDEWESRVIKVASYKQVKNPYEEMLEWTLEGKFPEFPINNEVGMEHEFDVPFHKHVFLHELLEDGFPKQGPVRQFMEVVILGLSQNPHLTREEKEDHVSWFREYFNEKYELLRTLGTVKDDEKMLDG